ncbi:MAG TPA: TadE/TadG family type IV pilus assembly protein [Rhizomicrobium sp.]
MLIRLRKFLKARDGLAAIEFAFIAPLLVTMLLGTVEVSNALECRQKVTMLASSAADLVAQTASVSSSDMTNIFNAVTAIVYPFPQSTTVIVISSVMSDGNGGGTVAWSQANSGAALTAGSAVAFSTPIMSTCNTAVASSCTPCAKNACSVIMAQITYNYTSPIGHFLVGSISMSDHFYARPRKSASVAYTG